MKYQEPIIVEWAPGTTRIGDFSYGGWMVFAKPEVQEFLNQTGEQIDWWKMVVRAPGSHLKERRPRVPFPYTGPDLRVIRPRVRLPVSASIEPLRVKSDCAGCGTIIYEDMFGEFRYKVGDSNRFMFFQLEQYGASPTTFVTERGLEILNEQKFSNINVVEAGTLDFH